MKAISDYGIIGYGIDIVQNEPLRPIVAFTYDGGQRFQFNQEIVLPDQFVFDPTPVQTMSAMQYTGVMTTARQHQTSLSDKVGMGGVCDGIEFSGQASAVNEMYSSSTATTVRQFSDSRAAYVILRIRRIDLGEGLLPEVADAAHRAAADPDGARDFLEAFGTHVVRSANIGGQISVRTELSLTSAASKKIAEHNVSLDAQAKVEALAYVNRKIAFKDRDTETSADFRSNSSVSQELIGGDIAAPDTDAWVESLNHSEIATRSGDFLFPGTLGDAGPRHYLGPVALQYVPIYEVLPLDRQQKDVFAAALKAYLGGKNPFDATPRRFLSNVPESKAIAPGKSVRFSMRGWMATYETYAGLDATPGSYAVVQCKSDAEPGGWTEKRVYAGETVQLRGKTPYMSGNMDVKFVKSVGDSGAVVQARNKLVSW